MFKELSTALIIAGYSQPEKLKFVKGQNVITIYLTDDGDIFSIEVNRYLIKRPSSNIDELKMQIYSRERN